MASSTSDSSKKHHTSSVTDQFPRAGRKRSKSKHAPSKPGATSPAHLFRDIVGKDLKHAQTLALTYPEVPERPTREDLEHLNRQAVEAATRAFAVEKAIKNEPGSVSGEDSLSTMVRALRADALRTRENETLPEGPNMDLLRSAMKVLPTQIPAIEGKTKHDCETGGKAAAACFFQSILGSKDGSKGHRLREGFYKFLDEMGAPHNMMMHGDRPMSSPTAWADNYGHLRVMSVFLGLPINIWNEINAETIQCEQDNNWTRLPDGTLRAPEHACDAYCCPFNQYRYGIVASTNSFVVEHAAEDFYGGAEDIKQGGNRMREHLMNDLKTRGLYQFDTQQCINLILQHNLGEGGISANHYVQRLVHPPSMVQNEHVVALRTDYALDWLARNHKPLFLFKYCVMVLNNRGRGLKSNFDNPNPDDTSLLDIMLKVADHQLWGGGRYNVWLHSQNRKEPAGITAPAPEKERFVSDETKAYCAAFVKLEETWRDTKGIKQNINAWLMGGAALQDRNERLKRRLAANNQEEPTFENYNTPPSKCADPAAGVDIAKCYDCRIEILINHCFLRRPDHLYRSNGYFGDCNLMDFWTKYPDMRLSTKVEGPLAWFRRKLLVDQFHPLRAPGVVVTQGRVPSMSQADLETSENRKHREVVTFQYWLPKGLVEGWTKTERKFEASAPDDKTVLAQILESSGDAHHAPWEKMGLSSPEPKYRQKVKGEKPAPRDSEDAKRYVGTARHTTARDLRNLKGQAVFIPTKVLLHRPNSTTPPQWVDVLDSEATQTLESFVKEKLAFENATLLRAYTPHFVMGETPLDWPRSQLTEQELKAKLWGTHIGQLRGWEVRFAAPSEEAAVSSSFASGPSSHKQVSDTPPSSAIVAPASPVSEAEHPPAGYNAERPAPPLTRKRSRTPEDDLEDKQKRIQTRFYKGYKHFFDESQSTERRVRLAHVAANTAPKEEEDQSKKKHKESTKQLSATAGRDSTQHQHPTERSKAPKEEVHGSARKEEAGNEKSATHQGAMDADAARERLRKREEQRLQQVQQKRQEREEKEKRRKEARKRDRDAANK